MGLEWTRHKKEKIKYRTLLLFLSPRKRKEKEKKRRKGRIYYLLIMYNDGYTQWAQDVHRTSPGRLLVPVYFRRPEDVKMGPDLDFILRDVLKTSLGRPIKNFN